MKRQLVAPQCIYIFVILTDHPVQNCAEGNDRNMIVTSVQLVSNHLILLHEGGPDQRIMPTVESDYQTFIVQHQPRVNSARIPWKDTITSS